MAVEMELHKIVIADMQDAQFIVLRELGGERQLPIVIGTMEALAINRRLKGIPFPRPQTHDLLASVIERMGGSLGRIEITRLEGGTFYAALHIQAGGGTVEVDCRPSDAIAVGVASGTPIFVAEEVLNAVS